MIAPSWTQATTAIKFEIIASFFSETFLIACLDVECYVSEIKLECRLQRLITEHVGEHMLDATRAFWYATPLY